MSIVYKLFSESCDSFYVGSTRMTLRQRLVKHRSKANEAPNRRVYKCIQENGGFSQWKIEPLEMVESDCGSERRRREQFYIDTLKPDLNTYLAIHQQDKMQEI